MTSDPLINALYNCVQQSRKDGGPGFPEEAKAVRDWIRAELDKVEETWGSQYVLTSVRHALLDVPQPEKCPTCEKVI